MWNLRLKYGIIVLAIIAVIVLGINLYVRLSTKKQIIKKDEYSNLSDVDCIIILGAAIWGDKPSPMLEDGELMGGYGQNIASFYGDTDMKVKNYGISKEFHTDFVAERLLEENGISVDKISKVIEEYKV